MSFKRLWLAFWRCRDSFVRRPRVDRRQDLPADAADPTARLTERSPIGLMLFSLRALDPVAQWKEGLITFGFWATNIGLFTMVTLSPPVHGHAALLGVYGMLGASCRAPACCTALSAG